MTEYMSELKVETTELKPCPFCGGKACICGLGKYQKEVYCENCGTVSDIYGTSQKAIEAWNRRAERTCLMVRARWDDGECVWGCRCTACGDRFTYETGTTWRYCPSCGARVEGLR